MSVLVGILGFINSGKGSVGEILVSEHRFTQDSFARPLKDAAAAIFGWNRDLLEGATPESREWREQPDEFWSKQFGRPFTPREALQLLGTEAGRNVFHENIWVSSLLHRSQGKNIVVTDVRFKNEIQALKDAGGILIRVKRGPDPVWWKTAVLANRGYEIEQAQMEKLGIHRSEWDWVGCDVDYTLLNEGTLSDLKMNVDRIMELERIDRS